MELVRAKGHGKYATYSLVLPNASWYVKLRPNNYLGSLKSEAERIEWGKGHLPVPERAIVRRIPGISLLITSAIEGQPSHKCIGKIEPSNILNGLSNVIHDFRQVNTKSFPFTPPEWTTEKGIETNFKQLSLSKDKHRQLHPDFSNLSLSELRNILDNRPENPTQSLSHGDLCMPNVLLNNRGLPTGVVDVGALHVGDDKLDLAVMSWTMQANMGDTWANHLLNLHGALNTDSAITFNRLIYDLSLKHSNPWAWTQSPQLAEQRRVLVS